MDIKPYQMYTTLEIHPNIIDFYAKGQFTLKS